MTLQDFGSTNTLWPRDERRDLPRWTLRDEANLTVFTHYGVSCPIQDVSGSGIALWTDIKPSVGDEAIIHVHALGRFRAQVTRVADGRVAFQFMIDDERQIILIQRLENRLRRQDSAPLADT